ncbi:unnamed protein product [Zymoseptoria tritici ST99CH_3D7]|uniref:CFEM domain-containing protein n=1 Tax=Zymoseptoria tritici (strain ST99CH_3D7) TaxID=1276538 RepID=A0A1X7S161_ZYMT9|nr:unnamed protein product [Zymoseptoria tritici ST99CH_3D7]
MRLSWSLLGLWTVLGLCQKTAPVDPNILQQILTTIPQCALPCTAQAAAASPCAANDFECTCNDPVFNAQVERCVVSSCTIKQSLTSKNASEALCNRNPPTLKPPIVPIGLAIATLGFLLRILAKLPLPWGLYPLQPLWWDDAVLVVAMILFVIPGSALGIVLVNTGLGSSIWTIPFENITKILHIYYFEGTMYLTGLSFIRISMLLTYLRIFPGAVFRQMAFLSIGLNVVCAVVFFLLSTFQCVPVSYSWHRWDGEHEGHCYNIHLQIRVAAIVNILLDVAAVVLPLPQLWKMKLNTPKKLLVFLMFTIGLLVPIVSVIRLQTLVQFGNAMNVTYVYARVGYWSSAEQHLAVLCACMPAIRNLIRRFWKRSTTVTHASKSTNSSGNIANSNDTMMEAGSWPREERHSIPLKDIYNDEDRRYDRKASHTASPGSFWVHALETASPA